MEEFRTRIANEKSRLNFSRCANGSDLAPLNFYPSNNEPRTRAIEIGPNWLIFFFLKFTLMTDLTNVDQRMSRIERKYCLITSYLTELYVFWWLFSNEDTL